MSLLEAILLAFVEGLTEFLPISSTGHMVIVSSLMGIEGAAFTKLFEVAVQLGAIMAVVILYRRKFMQFTQWQFYAKLLVGALPILVGGLLFNDVIDSLLESPLTVALSLLFGGIVLLFVDKWFGRNPHTPTDLLATETTVSELIEADDRLTYKKSFLVGCWQLLALVPGVSRSASSIIGGMQQRLTRNFAAEFSFFLSVPTMFAASAYSLFLKTWEDGGRSYKGYELIAQSKENMLAFAVGNLVAFGVALLAIRFFIQYLKKYGFRVFGIYRVAVGALLLLLILTGVIK